MEMNQELPPVDVNVTWQPSNPTSWADALGLIPLPFFSDGRNDRPGGFDGYALLDGKPATLVLFDGDEVDNSDARSRLWSADMRHGLIPESNGS
ncbi:MAG: hypothetical protein IH851_12225, partial [Armatimonadetes bacterium]|nr:hypothetical protein [Armatimonadota bacterium]